MESAASNLPRTLGRYEIVGRLAYGGMAEILLGRLTGPSGFERPVVIKRILPQLATVPSFVDMLLDEGRLAARIRHPNVGQVQELCRQDGELFLVLEYIEGESCAGLARRCRVRRRHPGYGLCAYVVAEACSGLHAAHELTDANGAPLDIVHRDVSPQNIFVGYDGTVKILDFGIAKAADRITRTEAGTLKGKFEYMSPEQAMGEALDRRSDVFSLGVVLYELTTQRRLFKRGTDLATLRAVTDDPIVPPSRIVPDYPAALEDICLTALARERTQRHGSAHDLRRDLLTALRELDAPPMPEEALSKLMHELFEDRIEQKKELLYRMREGLTPSHVPVADADAAVELPSIEIGPELETDVSSRVRTRPYADRSSELPAQPRRSRAPWLVAALVLLAGGVGAALWMAGIGPASDEPAPDIAPTVELTIDSDPSGANVLLDERTRGTTPLVLNVDRGESPVVLRLEREGHEPVEEVVTPDVSQRLRLSLPVAALPEASGETADGVEANDARSAERRRRARAARRAADEASSMEASSMEASSMEAGSTEAVSMEAGDDRERAFRRFN